MTLVDCGLGHAEGTIDPHAFQVDTCPFRSVRHGHQSGGRRTCEALTLSVLQSAPAVSIATCRSSAVRRAGGCVVWPFTRRNWVLASTMPVAHRRNAICPSRQR